MTDKEYRRRPKDRPEEQVFIAFLGMFWLMLVFGLFYMHGCSGYLSKVMKLPPPSHSVPQEKT